jgi:hypothetical protein
MKRKLIALSFAVAVATAGAVAPATGAFAKITPVTTNTSCENGGGNLPQGQQPTCTGSGLTQNSTTTNETPAGHAPPGQNP